MHLPRFCTGAEPRWTTAADLHCLVWAWLCKVPQLRYASSKAQRRLTTSAGRASVYADRNWRAELQLCGFAQLCRAAAIRLSVHLHLRVQPYFISNRGRRGSAGRRPVSGHIDVGRCPYAARSSTSIHVCALRLRSIYLAWPRSSACLHHRRYRMQSYMQVGTRGSLLAQIFATWIAVITRCCCSRTWL